MKKKVEEENKSSCLLFRSGELSIFSFRRAGKERLSPIFSIHCQGYKTHKHTRSKQATSDPNEKEVVEERPRGLLERCNKVQQGKNSIILDW